MDEELRHLERLAARGDPGAAARLELYRERLGLGWWGERLPAGFARGARRPRYRLPGGRELPFALAAPARPVALLAATPHLAPGGPPPAPFPHEEGDALLAADWPWALLDLHPAPTISSRSLGGLIRAVDRFKAAGGLLVTCRPSARVGSILQMLGIEALVELHPTRREALAALAAAPGG